MANHLNKRHHSTLNKNQHNSYGKLKQVIEADTDVNEDSNRERLLDESFDAFQALNEDKYLDQK